MKTIVITVSKKGIEPGLVLFRITLIRPTLNAKFAENTVTQRQTVLKNRLISKNNKKTRSIDY